MNLELSDEQAAALEREIDGIIDDDRYPLSPRMQVLRDILAKATGIDTGASTCIATTAL
jgi:hypothetical protein